MEMESDDANSKRASLEDLPKEDLIKKCKGLLNILQKAKQSKEVLLQENGNLKDKLKNCESDGEMLEGLVQQKVQLITALEETKSQKKVLENRLKDCEYNLSVASEKTLGLENDNLGCRRQITRLVDENEVLLSRLDVLEKATEQEQLSVKENSELEETNKNLGRQNKELLGKFTRLTDDIKLLETGKEIDGKRIAELEEETVKHQTVISNLEAELTKQGANDRLKDKLKLFHSKLVKFAGDVRSLKQEKNEILMFLKDYTNQAKLWEAQLSTVSGQFLIQFGIFEKEKLAFESSRVKLEESQKIIDKLQTRCALLQDELDSKSAETLADRDDLIAKLRAEIEELNAEKSNVEVWKRQVSRKVQNLKRELEVTSQSKTDLENELKRTNADLDEKNRSLNDEIDKHNSTKSLLLESHNDRKKHSVLDLEIRDYERSLKDVTQKLDKKRDSIAKLKEQLDQQNVRLCGLKEQNGLLEERVLNEEKQSSNARAETQTYKSRLTDLEQRVLEKDNQLLDLTVTLENTRAKNEQLSTDLSKIVSDNVKICDSLKSEKQSLHLQNVGLEGKIREIQLELTSKDENLKETVTEFEAYKVRAQSVLRSSQVRDVSTEEKLLEEISSFKAQVEILTCKSDDLRIAVENLKEDNSKLSAEKEDMRNKCHSNEIDLDEQKQLYDTLSAKHQTTIAENLETISSLKVHADTLSLCYRRQLSEQEARHNKEIIEFQTKIEKIPPMLDTPTFVLPSTPREQGEGSECVDSPKLVHPLSLDKLLNGDEIEQDAGFLRRQISEHETKLSYLTSLLADTEQDLAKHVQMNGLLKEEIRRQQRSVEREKHADNLEYLKNVVFKFATLSSGDERSRLVPVLNTILKFSPGEIGQLNSVARGESAGRGWTNYLPMWSNGNG